MKCWRRNMFQIRILLRKHRGNIVNIKGISYGNKSQWCYLTISSVAAPFSFCLWSFPASGSFQKCWLFSTGSQSIGASTSASVLTMNIQDLFPLGLNGLISLESKDNQESSPAPQFESFNSSVLSLLYGPTLTICTWLLEKL